MGFLKVFLRLLKQKQRLFKEKLKKVLTREKRYL